jgi:G3E family GTPase
MANPAPFIETFQLQPDVAYNMRLDGVITLVDAAHVERHLDRKLEEPDAANEAVEQIAYADRILLNKVDLVSTTLV